MNSGSENRAAEMLLLLSEHGLLSESDFEVVQSGFVDIKIMCPFHEDENPSLSVNLKEGLWMCFGCGAKGDIVNLIGRLQKVDSFQALRKLHDLRRQVEEGGLKLQFKAPRSRLELLGEALDCFRGFSRPNWQMVGEEGRYMLERGFRPSTLKLFDVRLSPGSEHPVIVPLIEQGVFKGYVRRRTSGDSEPKYLYNKGFVRNSTLVGNLVEGKKVLITEGIMDLMKAVQYGAQNSCAILGWQMSWQQMRKVRGFTRTVISALDNTPTGKKGTEVLRKHFKVIRFKFPKTVKDLGEMSEFHFRKALFDSFE